MMNGLWRRCVVSAVGAIGLSSMASATVIQYQPHDEQRGVIMDGDGEFTDALGLWSESITDGSRFAEQTSLLGPQLIVGWSEVSGSGMASHMNVRFSVANDVPFDLTASASAGGLVVILQDLTLSSTLAVFTTFGAESATFSGELTAGHNFALLNTMIDPFGGAPSSQVTFSIHQGGPRLVPTPGAFATLAIGGLLAGGRRRRS